MELEIKKDLTSDWFKTLQEVFCDDICKLEKNKYKPLGKGEGSLKLGPKAPPGNYFIQFKVGKKIFKHCKFEYWVN